MKQYKPLKIFIYILASLALVSLGAFGFWIYQEKFSQKTPALITLPTPPAKLTKFSDWSDWKIYKGQEFEIKYPGDFITLSQEGNSIKLAHSIKHTHYDPCDFRDNVSSLQRLIDFDVDIEVINSNLGEAVLAKEGDYFSENILPNNQLQILSGFIDEVSIGSLKGYQITTGVEGCGEYKYYFSLNSETTLFIRRRFITEFKPIVLDYQKYLNLPGIIPPEEEERLFEKIISSFKFLGQQSAQPKELSDSKIYKIKISQKPNAPLPDYEKYRFLADYLIDILNLSKQKPFSDDDVGRKIFFDTTTDTPYTEENKIYNSSYFIILEKADLQPGKYEDQHTTIEVENADVKLSPYLDNSDYCQEDQDCLIRTDFCEYGSFNKYHRFIDVWGCGLFSDETGDSFGLYDENMGCETDVQYSHSQCINNQCIAQGRSLSCRKNQ